MKKKLISNSDKEQKNSVKVLNVSKRKRKMMNISLNKSIHSRFTRRETRNPNK